jgi:hypothetical protein
MIIPIVWVALTGLSAGVLPGYLATPWQPVSIGSVTWERASTNPPTVPPDPAPPGATPNPMVRGNVTRGHGTGLCVFNAKATGYPVYSLDEMAGVIIQEVKIESSWTGCASGSQTYSTTTRHYEMIEMVARPDGTITQKIPDSFAVYGGYSPSHWSVEMSAIGMYIPWHGNEALIRDLSKRMNQPGQPGAGNPTTGGPQVPFPNGDPNPEGYIYHPIPNGNTDGTIGGVNSNNSHYYPNSVSPPRSELNGPGSMKSWENLYGGVADIVVVAGNPSGVKQFNNWGDSCPGGKSNSEGVNSTP